MQRTFLSVKVNAAIFDGKEMTDRETIIAYNGTDFVETETGLAIAQKSESKIIKRIVKALNLASSNGLYVKSLTKIEELRYMSDEDFYLYSVPMSEVKAAKAE